VIVENDSMRGAWLGLLCVLVCGWFIACGSDGGSAGTGGFGGSAASGVGGSAAEGGTVGQGGNAGAGQGGSAATGQGGSAAAGGSVNQDADIPDVTFTYDAPIEDSSVSQDSACAATSVEAKPVPLDMYVMLDRSGSMGTDCNVPSTGTSKWCYSVNALYNFFASPTSTGTGVALQYFPISGYSCTGSGGACATPAVGLGLLPPLLPNLQASLSGETPNGSNTPTEAGIRGLVDFTGKNKQPGRTIIGILITDGAPNGCNTGAAYLGGLLTTHFNATGIRTFVIGMTGAIFTTLETIASGAGAAQHNDYCGTAPPCRHYSVGNGDPLAFNAVLKAIQNVAIGCQYQLPQTDAGVIDPAKVTVQYTPGGTGVPQKLQRVNDASQCGPQGGWYYDNNTNPTTITLCPATCTVVTADASPKVDILLGCQGS
jgi:hypothetical protein